jgi:metal-dependent amidase/aminoacylase/carboxypeptidase family protein
MKALFGETMKGQIDRFVSIDNADPHVTTIGVGSHRYRITFNGPGGHSFADFGMPNPANALGRAITKMSEFQVTDNPRTTFNVGRIGGGTSVNAIPSEVWLEIDLRSSNSSALAALDARLRQAVDHAVIEENARWGARA